MAMQIALFGTSADPPHAGHQMVLRWLGQSFDLVWAWASDNPYKANQTPLAHREAMLHLLIADLDGVQANVQLCPELSHPRAIVTVKRARHRWPEAEFTWVVGSDLVHQIPHWWRVEDLLQQVKLLVVPRSGYPLSDHDLMELRALGATIAIAELTGPNVSSTAVRQFGYPTGLTAPVKAYIHREHLYPCQDSSRSQPLR